MAVALICVALGFLMKQKSVRIYGLVLSMFVCVKLVFFDVADAASLVKTIMYFVVGILALVIAGVYIVAEMLVNKKAQAAANPQPVAPQPVTYQPVQQDVIMPVQPQPQMQQDVILPQQPVVPEQNQQNGIQ
jgi:hypothetical protein